MFSKITFLKSVHSKEKNQACVSFLENIFTKSVHRGGVQIVRMTNVFHDAKTVKIVKEMSFVPKENVFLPIAKKIVIVDQATNALIKNVSLDVKKIKQAVMRAENVLMAFVPFHQVILCDLIINLAQPTKQLAKIKVYKVDYFEFSCIKIEKLV